MGANQDVTDSDQVTANVGIEFTGDGGTFTNTAGATITATPGPNGVSKIMSGPDFNQYNIPYSNLTINNAGTLQYQSNPASGSYFAGNPVFSAGVQTGVTAVTGITINNLSTGVIAGLDTSTHHDDVPLSFEDGTNGAVVNNAGTISTAGGSMTAGGVRVSAGIASYLAAARPHEHQQHYDQQPDGRHHSEYAGRRRGVDYAVWRLMAHTVVLFRTSQSITPVPLLVVRRCRTI